MNRPPSRFSLALAASVFLEPPFGRRHSTGADGVATPAGRKWPLLVGMMPLLLVFGCDAPTAAPNAESAQQPAPTEEVQTLAESIAPLVQTAPPARQAALPQVSEDAGERTATASPAEPTEKLTAEALAEALTSIPKMEVISGQAWESLDEYGSAGSDAPWSLARQTRPSRLPGGDC